MNPIHKEQVERTHVDFVNMCGAFSTSKQQSARKSVNARFLTKVIFVTCLVKEKPIPKNLNFSSLAYWNKSALVEHKDQLNSLLGDTLARKTLSSLLNNPFAPFENSSMDDEQKISASLQFMEEITDVLYIYLDNTELYEEGSLVSEVNRYLDKSMRFNADVFYTNYLNFQNHKELGIVETSDPSIAMYEPSDFKQILYRTWEAYIEGKTVPQQITDLMFDSTFDDEMDKLFNRLFFTKGRLKFFTYPVLHSTSKDGEESPFVLIALPKAVREGFEWSVIHIQNRDETTINIDQVPFHGLPFYLENVLHSAGIDELTRALEDQAKQFVKV
ncbi:hypothetical protein EVJ20_07545 [Exiguobacterium sp. SH0S1]|uniref:hypothetical protein n=1 Tax=Exiguobacterium sp. SH0S1 TaxID=2510949 RepID=UPI0010390ED0|nr:hypothetical protein [Exiguobacterium sp. SH0S1]TCI77806.1 hypothetical protein EVJ20_07545 [Exiguobacterium sp. SH0S1]